MSLTLTDECQAWKDTIRKEMFMYADKYEGRESLTTARTRMSMTGSLLLDRPSTESAASSMRSWRSTKKGSTASTFGGASSQAAMRREPRHSPEVRMRSSSRSGAGPLMRRSKSASAGLFGVWMP
eukprot:TRINITY_DN82133_c0_g1_i2.p1 TRINITY_DN82133_c0_g1~~TRINITY_DN82133_c0_g1_i2.p1  ORF type:complete len:143 (+),score=12.96 TRINITY_DN82133_c0_g1_i2:56-430(+)